MNFKFNDIEKMTTDMVTNYIANGFVLAFDEHNMGIATFYFRKEGERKRAIVVENAYVGIGYSAVTAIRVIECYADNDYKKWHYEDLISEKVFYNLNNNIYEEGYYTDNKEEVESVEKLRYKRGEDRNYDESPLTCNVSDKLLSLIRQRAGYKRIKAVDLVLYRTDDGYIVQNTKNDKSLYVYFPAA